MPNNSTIELGLGALKATIKETGDWQWPIWVAVIVYVGHPLAASLGRIGENYFSRRPVPAPATEAPAPTPAPPADTPPNVAHADTVKIYNTYIFAGPAGSAPVLAGAPVPPAVLASLASLAAPASSEPPAGGPDAPAPPVPPKDAPPRFSGSAATFPAPFTPFNEPTGRLGGQTSKNLTTPNKKRKDPVAAKGSWSTW
ncbi:hypothetical protein PRK78_002436 [Emydomyces testavorans]|uniref:Uncharacterized protein n=1 Tax=Emydomyces testavorans TaxID=2070801 RepID=A0AAF0DGC6_9EURO|nr:hypothetical protein PRK78_002436 [Emydomyces testavorans]